MPCGTCGTSLASTDESRSRARQAADEYAGLYSLGVPQEYVKTQERYEKAAQGAADAQFNLGWLYRHGRGVPQDGGEARGSGTRRLPRGGADAPANLGWRYANGRGVPQDYGKAREWYEKAAAQGNADAQGPASACCTRIAGVFRDYAKAREWYEKAAARGTSPTRRRILQKCREWKGGHKKDSISCDYLGYRQAAKQGSEYAKKALAIRN